MSTVSELVLKEEDASWRLVIENVQNGYNPFRLAVNKLPKLIFMKGDLYSKSYLKVAEVVVGILMDPGDGSSNISAGLFTCHSFHPAMIPNWNLMSPSQRSQFPEEFYKPLEPESYHKALLRYEKRFNERPGGRQAKVLCGEVTIGWNYTKNYPGTKVLQMTKESRWQATPGFFSPAIKWFPFETSYWELGGGKDLVAFGGYVLHASAVTVAVGEPELVHDRDEGSDTVVLEADLGPKLAAPPAKKTAGSSGSTVSAKNTVAARRIVAAKNTVAFKTVSGKNSAVASKTVSAKYTVAVSAKNTAASKRTVPAKNTVASKTVSAKNTVASKNTVSAKNTVASKNTVSAKNTVASKNTVKNTVSAKNTVASKNTEAATVAAKTALSNITKNITNASKTPGTRTTPSDDEYGPIPKKKRLHDTMIFVDTSDEEDGK
jgi:hypothetical protein